MTGLTPGTTYEYKLRVQTAGGTVESAAEVVHDGGRAARREPDAVAAAVRVAVARTVGVAQPCTERDPIGRLLEGPGRADQGQEGREEGGEGGQEGEDGQEEEGRQESVQEGEGAREEGTRGRSAPPARLPVPSRDAALLSVVLVLALPGTRLRRPSTRIPAGTGLRLQRGGPVHDRPGLHVPPLGDDTISIGAGVYMTPTPRSLTDSLHDLTIIGVHGPRSPDPPEHRSCRSSALDSTVEGRPRRPHRANALIAGQRRRGGPGDRQDLDRQQLHGCVVDSGTVLHDSVCIGQRP